MKFRYIALIILLLFGTSVFAATSGSILIMATVPESVHVSLSSSEVFISANQSSESMLMVTSLTVASTGHWALSIESKNGSYLLNSDDANSRIHYLFSLGSLTSSPIDLRSSWTSGVQSPTSSAGITLSLAILLQKGEEFVREGTYDDWLTINIKQF